MNKIELYHIVYHTIKLNPGITQNQIAWLISSNLDYTEQEVTDTLDAISRKGEMPKCVSRYVIPKSKTRKGQKVVKYMPNKSSIDFVEATFTKYQEQLGYIVPDLIFRR